MSTPQTSPPWYADGLRFTCTQCGRCCGGAPGYVWLREDELDRIAGRLGLSADQFRQQHTRRVGARLSLLEKWNGDCEFLLRREDGSSGCSIYADRPLQCRTWPFWKSNVRSRRSWEHAARDCPGMNDGEHHALPVIQSALRENALASLPL